MMKAKVAALPKCFIDEVGVRQTTIVIRAEVPEDQPATIVADYR